jgi:hypothetical protein
MHHQLTDEDYMWRIVLCCRSELRCPVCNKHNLSVPMVKQALLGNPGLMKAWDHARLNTKVSCSTDVTHRAAGDITRVQVGMGNVQLTRSAALVVVPSTDCDSFPAPSPTATTTTSSPTRCVAMLV